MYYFFLALLFWHLTKQVEQRSLGFWIQAGTYLALLSLVKPHALLLIPGIGTYLLFTQWGEATGRWMRLLKEGGSFLVSVLAVKFGLGLIFAGPSGITFFGGAYTGTLNGSLSAGTGAGATDVAAAGIDRTFGTSLGFISGQIGVEILAVVFLGALPLAAAIRYLSRSSSTVAQNKPLADFSFLIVNSLAWMVVLIAIFSNMTRMSGEDTANRIMLRYFEFLIPLLLITLVATAERGFNLKASWRWVVATVISVLSIVASTFITQVPTGAVAPRYNLQFVDSPLLKVFLGTLTYDSKTGAPIYWMSIVTVVMTVVALAIWAANPKWASVTWLAAIMPVLLLLSNNAMITSYAWRSTYTMASDTAGEFVRDSIPQSELKNLIIVAPTNSNKSELVAKFHVNNPDVQSTEINEGGTYAAPTGDTAIKWEMALGNVTLSDPGFVVAQAGGVELLRRDLGDIEYFNNHTHAGTLVVGTQGLDRTSAQGLCATQTTAIIHLSKQVMSQDKLLIGLSASGAGAGAQYTIRLGETTQNLNLQNPQRPVDASILATNNQATQDLYLNMPNAQSGLCISYLEYTSGH